MRRWGRRAQPFAGLFGPLRAVEVNGSLSNPPERVQWLAWRPTPRCSLAAKRRLGGAARDDPNAAIGIARSAPARDRDAGDVDRVSVCSTATLRGRHLVPPFGQLQLPGRRRSGGLRRLGRNLLAAQSATVVPADDVPAAGADRVGARSGEGGAGADQTRDYGCGGPERLVVQSEPDRRHEERREVLGPEDRAVASEADVRAVRRLEVPGGA